MSFPAHYLKIIRWSARWITILFAAFLSIFAADVFGEGLDVLHTIIALFMHLIPSFAILLALWLSWKREWIGAIFYPFLGVLYIWWAWGRFPLSVYFMIAGPLFLLGGLYCIGWCCHESEIEKNNNGSV